MPVFADQLYNVRNAVHRGIAIDLHINELNEEKLTTAIKEILENPIYKQNMIKYSSVLQDQPMKPLDLAVHQIEFVLKYKNPEYLQSPALKLNWFQVHLLDVLAFLCVVLLIIFLVFHFIIKACLKRLLSKLYIKKYSKSKRKKL